MANLCTCPLASSFPDVPNFECAENFGQVQKAAIQLLQSTPGTDNGFTSDAAITKKASWQTYLSADDGTKIVVTPYFVSPTAEAGEAITSGGGNDSLNGVEVVQDRNPTPFSASLRGMPQTLIKALKEIQCWAQSEIPAIGVYLFTGDGRIGCLSDGDGGHKPIPVVSFFVGDKTLGGFGEQDTNVISWSFLPNWSDDLVLVSPGDFNPLRDLVNSAA